MNILKEVRARLLHTLSEGSLPSAPLKSRYSHLLRLFVEHDPTSMIEIGVWRGDRTLCFLKEGKNLHKYVGFDLFEEMTDKMFHDESMGKCTPQLELDVLEKIRPYAQEQSCQIELVKGLTEETLPKFCFENDDKFDFIYIDGGHSIEAIENDWNYARRLISTQGLVIFDDYYLNDDKRGAKKLIDGLLDDKSYRVRFFPMIEDIIEDIQITMVAVWPQTH